MVKISDLIASHFFLHEHIDSGKYKDIILNSIGVEKWNDLGLHYIFNIENTIHYKAIIEKNFSLYNEYIKEGWGIDRENLYKQILNCEDESKLFGVHPLEIKWNPKYEKYLITDGLHRTCYFLSKYGSEYYIKSSL
jgi:hypothetical protein